MALKRNEIEVKPVVSSASTVSSDRQHYFVVKDGNGEIIATSELYDSKSNAERGAKNLKKSVRFAKVVS